MLHACAGAREPVLEVSTVPPTLVADYCQPEEPLPVTPGLTQAQPVLGLVPTCAPVEAAHGHTLQAAAQSHASQTSAGPHVSLYLAAEPKAPFHAHKEDTPHPLPLPVPLTALCPQGPPQPQFPTPSQLHTSQPSTPSQPLNPQPPTPFPHPGSLQRASSSRGQPVRGLMLLPTVQGTSGGPLVALTGDCGLTLFSPHPAPDLSASPALEPWQGEQEGDSKVLPHLPHAALQQPGVKGGARQAHTTAGWVRDWVLGGPAQRGEHTPSARVRVWPLLLGGHRTYGADNLAAQRMQPPQVTALAGGNVLWWGGAAARSGAGPVGSCLPPPAAEPGAQAGCEREGRGTAQVVWSGMEDGSVRAWDTQAAGQPSEAHLVGGASFGVCYLSCEVLGLEPYSMVNLSKKGSGEEIISGTQLKPNIIPNVSFPSLAAL